MTTYPLAIQPIWDAAGDAVKPEWTIYAVESTPSQLRLRMMSNVLYDGFERVSPAGRNSRQITHAVDRAIGPHSAVGMGRDEKGVFLIIQPIKEG